MITFQDYILEMQERTARLAVMREQSQLPRRECWRYGRLVAWLGAIMERVGRHLQAPKVVESHLDSLSPV